MSIVGNEQKCATFDPKYLSKYLSNYQNCNHESHSTKHLHVNA